MAHFYTGASPVCALCEATARTPPERPGCFASLYFEQGTQPLVPLCGYPHIHSQQKWRDHESHAVS